MLKIEISTKILKSSLFKVMFLNFKSYIKVYFLKFLRDNLPLKSLKHKSGFKSNA